MTTTSMTTPRNLRPSKPRSKKVKEGAGLYVEFVLATPRTLIKFMSCKLMINVSFSLHCRAARADDDSDDDWGSDSESESSSSSSDDDEDDPAKRLVMEHDQA